MLRIQSGSKSSSPINLRRRKFLRPIVAPSPRAWADDALEKWPSHASFCSRLFPRSFHFSPPPPLFIFRLIVSYSGYGSAYIHTQLLEDAFSREEYIYIYMYNGGARLLGGRFNYVGPDECCTHTERASCSLLCGTFKEHNVHSRGPTMAARLVNIKVL